MKSNKIFYKYFIIILFPFLIIACAQPQSQLPAYDSQASIEEQKIQNQMFADSWLRTYVDFADIGIDILFEASDLCITEDHIFDIGVDVANRYDPPESIRSEINKTLLLNENLKVVAIGQKTPAARIGIKKGDEIISINDNPAPNGTTANVEFYKLMKKKSSSNFDIVVLREQEEFAFSLVSEKRCRFNYIVDLDNNTFNAFADGNNLVFSLRMAKWLLQDEIGAAIVFAHELGHNANHHIDDKVKNQQAGAVVGLLLGIAIGLPQDMMEMGAGIGANSYSIDYENEADYLSIYALALSGYNISKAPNFWRRFAVEVPSSIYSGGGTHPSTSERYVRLETYVKEIQEKINNGDKPEPMYKKD